MDIFSNLGEIVESIGNAMVDGFELVSKIFYTPGASGQPGSVTLVGYLALASLSISLLGLGIRTIMKLIKQKA